jgi:hypothetical protein
MEDSKDIITGTHPPVDEDCGLEPREMQTQSRASETSERNEDSNDSGSGSVEEPDSTVELEDSEDDDSPSQQIQSSSTISGSAGSQLIEETLSNGSEFQGNHTLSQTPSTLFGNTQRESTAGDDQTVPGIGSSARRARRPLQPMNCLID